MIEKLKTATLPQKLLIALIVVLLIFGLRVVTGAYLCTPKVTQHDLNDEAKIAAGFAGKRATDAAKGGKELATANVATTKIEYRNCKLSDEDFKNLVEAFKK